MEFSVVGGNLINQQAEAVVVNLFAGVSRPSGGTGAVDDALGGLISKLIQLGEIRGSAGELTVIHTLGETYDKFSPDRVLVAGLGSRDKFDLDGVRNTAANVARHLRNLGIRSAASLTHGAGEAGLLAHECAEAIAEGTSLGLYRFDKYVTKTADQENVNQTEFENLVLVEIDPDRIEDLRSGVEKGKIFAEAEILARDMVNEPPNRMGPTDLAEFAQSIADASNHLECTVMDRDLVEKLGMGAYLGVAQGSHTPPKLIRVDYKGDRDNPDNNIWLIGKGITFDSGGLSLKPSSGMETMKSDMAGGASVIASAAAIERLEPRINVSLLCLATENMPGGGAQRVGDVVTSISGKTIEILNTDAEGRLTLADALEYARNEGASKMVDVATLTGGITIALGHGYSGAFSNNDELVDAVISAGASRGDPMWRLPLDDLSKRQNRSKVADIKNTGGRPAHATTGAHFIGEFAGDIPWVHLDIASTAMIDSTRGWKIEGATGVPTRTLIQLVLDLSKG